MQAWNKVMAAYCRVDGLKSPAGLYIGISSGPNEYGRTLPLSFRTHAIWFVTQDWERDVAPTVTAADNTELDLFVIC